MSKSSRPDEGPTRLTPDSDSSGQSPAADSEPQAADQPSIGMLRRYKRFILLAANVGLSLGIVAALVYQAVSTKVTYTPTGSTTEQTESVVSFLTQGTIGWGFLILGAVCCMLGAVLTFIRWWYLVWTLGIPLRLTDALRMGFIGYLFNLAPAGVVGGDVIKSILIARKHPEHRTKSVASVFIDRIIGLYILFVVALGAAILSGLWKLDDPETQAMFYVAMTVSAVGAVGIGLLMWPAVMDGKLVRKLEHIPRVGHIFEKVVEALRQYRDQPMVLVVAALITVGVHTSVGTGIFLIAKSLYSESANFATLPYGETLLVFSLSASTGAIPLAAGPFETLLNVLYVSVGKAVGVATAIGQGTIIALMYRVCTIVIATIGFVYYLVSRREVVEAAHDAEELDDPMALDAAPETTG